MSYIKHYVIGYFLSILEIIISLFILNIFYYYDLISNNAFKVFELLCILIIIFINSYLMCKRSNIKRFICGTTFVLPYILISIICTLFNKCFQLRLLIYYLILLFISLLGSYFYKKKDD